MENFHMEIIRQYFQQIRGNIQNQKKNFKTKLNFFLNTLEPNWKNLLKFRKNYNFVCKCDLIKAKQISTNLMTW